MILFMIFYIVAFLIAATVKANNESFFKFDKKIGNYSPVEPRKGIYCVNSFIAICYKIYGIFFLRKAIISIIYVGVVSIFLLIPISDSQKGIVPNNVAHFIMKIPLITIKDIFGLSGVILAFVYFIYSQQKIETKPVNFFIGFPIFSLITVLSIIILYSVVLDTKLFVQHSQMVAVLFVALCIIFLIQLWNLIDKMRSTLNMRLVLPDLVKQFGILILLMYCRPILARMTFDKKYVFNKLYMYQEAIHQAFQFYLNNMMFTAFLDSYRLWIRIGVAFSSEEFLTPSFLKRDVIYEELYKKYPIEFEEFYMGILNCQIGILSTLYKTDNYFLIEEVENDFSSIYSLSIKSLPLIYFQALYTLLTVSSGKGRSDRLAHALSKFLKEYPDVGGSISLITKVLLKNIQENKMDDLLMYTNLFFDLVISSNNLPGKENISFLYKEQIGILFRLAIKSLELGHYKQTGFLVKFITDMFGTDMVNQAFEEISKDKSYPIVCENYDLLKVEFYNKNSEFTLDELRVLLYCQQLYLIYRKEKKDNIGPVILKPPVKKYIHYFNKVVKEPAIYGLEFPYDYNFMEKIISGVYGRMHNEFKI